MTSDFKYAAFISYRHLPRDTEVAKQVQHAIETYKLPHGVQTWQPEKADSTAIDQGLAPTETNAPSTAPFTPGKPLGRCFRDEDELAASTSLPAHITEVLKQSSALIVVCSLETQESAWVQREIEAFKDFHGDERIFTALAAGEPNTSIPEILRSKTVIDVGDIERAIPTEPLAADFRKEHASKLEQEKLRLIAAIAGCGFDDLRQRQRQRKRKRMGVSAVAAIALAGLIGGFAWSAHTNAQTALIEESKTLAAQSQQLYSQGDRYGAIEAALQALPTSEADTGHPLVPEAQTALEEALQVTQSNDSWSPCYSMLYDGVGRLVLNENAKVVGLIPDNEAEPLFYDLPTGRKIETLDQDIYDGLLDSHGNINNNAINLELAQMVVDNPYIIDARTGENVIFICSYDLLPLEEWGQPYPWRIQAIDTDMNPLWEYSDTSSADIALSLQINGNLGYAGLPFIISYGKTTQTLIVAVHNKAIFLDSETGEKINELTYPMPIVSASWFLHETDTDLSRLYAACADGSILWKNPFDNTFVGEGFASKFQLPSYITQAVFGLYEDGELYVAAIEEVTDSRTAAGSIERVEGEIKNRILVYRYGMRAEDNTTNYSLDELLALAHETLEAAGR